MYSGTRGRSGTVGNESYWQSAIFFTWYHRFHAGPYSHVYLSSLTACRIFKGKKERQQALWLHRLTKQHRCKALGILLIVPLVSDEVLCAGSALLKIPLFQFLKIGIIAKIISVGMISFSGSFGVLCGLEHWQIIAAELLMMFLASAGLQYFCKESG